MTPVHVIGASGRTGAVLCRLLLARHIPFVPVVRDPARWAEHGIAVPPRIADLTDPPSLHAALAGAERIASVSFAAWTHAILAAAPANTRLVLTGTARRYSPLPDPAGNDARQAEALLLASGRDAAMLHPTMIYGARNDGTVSRIADAIRRWPVLPMPGAQALVQPVHAADLAAAILAALDRRWTTPAAIPIGGPQPISNADLALQVARAARLRRPLIVPIPSGLVKLAGRHRPAVLRWLEDRTVPEAGLRDLLGISARPLPQGLADLFGPA